MIWFRNEFLTWKDSENILISSHANSLRGFLRFLEKIDESEIEKLKIPTGELVRVKLEGVSFVDKEILSGADWGIWEIESEKDVIGCLERPLMPFGKNGLAVPISF